MEDIVERLKREVRVLSLKCECDCVNNDHNVKTCGDCRRKLLMWEATQEIEELRIREIVKEEQEFK